MYVHIFHEDPNQGLWLWKRNILDISSHLKQENSSPCLLAMPVAQYNQHKVELKNKKQVKSLVEKTSEVFAKSTKKKKKLNWYSDIITYLKQEGFFLSSRTSWFLSRTQLSGTASQILRRRVSASQPRTGSEGIAMWPQSPSTLFLVYKNQKNKLYHLI